MKTTGLSLDVSRAGRDCAARAAILAELIGADTCIAAGIGAAIKRSFEAKRSFNANGSTPILKLCRQLIAAGHDPADRLEVYRGATLALRVRSIGEAAGLEINGDGSGFRAVRAPDAAPLITPGVNSGVALGGNPNDHPGGRSAGLS